MSFSYKNITDQEHMIPGIGIVKAGETISSEVKLESKNLQEVTAPSVPTPTPPPVQQPQVQEGGKEE